MKLLSKTNYMKGLQCSKLLWFSINSKAIFPKINAEQQKIFNDGNEVGELAKRIYPTGIDCYHKSNEENIKITKAALKKKKPLFEAGINFKNAYARADILVPVKNGWDIIEVKSTTCVKDEHLLDVAYQYYIFKNYGLKINNCYVMYLNEKYVRKGKIDVKEIFFKNLIDPDINGIKEKIAEMNKIMIMQNNPKIDIGPYCDKPYTCPLKDVMCWKHIPKNSVFELGGNKKCWELYNQGIILIKNIPSNIELKDKMKIQLECAKSGKPHIEKKVIKEFFSTLKYPLHYFDFETFSTAIPLYNNIKPYQQIPFQYSLHVENKHYSFLSLKNEDPRLELLKSMKKNIGPKGSIIAYYKIFEINRLKELANNFPEYKKWIDSIIPRFVDLLDIFKNFNCYYSSQGNSASLKEVLPAFTGKDYSHLKIGNGTDATLAFLSVVKGTKNENEVRADLEKYCCQDTEGMIWIMNRLKKEINEK